MTINGIQRIKSRSGQLIRDLSANSDPSTPPPAKSHRYSRSGNWQRDGDTGRLNASVFAIDYGMDLWSNFTYFVDPDGDQYHQVDDRMIYGWDIAWTTENTLAGLPVTHTLGTQMRDDDIGEVGIFTTSARQNTGVFRTDAVDQWSTGLYRDQELNWSDKLRTQFGLRYDYYDFRVKPQQADLAPSLLLNGSTARDSIVTASLGASYALSNSLETYIIAGQGFHSNDARGTTIVLDSVSGEPLDRADPLVDTRGYEFGLRAYFDDRLNASVALWSLDIDSGMLFVGDSGATVDGILLSRQQLDRGC